jgi:hypothetical protein
MPAFAAASMACDSRGCFDETSAIAPRDHSGRRRMKALSYLVSFSMAICGLMSLFT